MSKQSWDQKLDRLVQLVHKQTDLLSHYLRDTRHNAELEHPPGTASSTDETVRKQGWWSTLTPAEWIQVGIGVVLILTLIVSIKSYAVSRDSLVAIQRAFLVPIFNPHTDVNDVVMPDGTTIKDAVHFRIDWENVGGTAAPIVISDAHYQEVPDDEPPGWQLKFGETNFEKTFLGPHAKSDAFQLILVPKADLLTKKPGVHVAIWGWKVYRDISLDPRSI